MTNDLIASLRSGILLLAVIAGMVPEGSAQAYSSPCGMSVSIPDNSCGSPLVYSVEVSEINGNRMGYDVVLKSVNLIISHTFAADVEISLRSPSGIVIPLSVGNGSYGNNYGNPQDIHCEQVASFIRDAVRGSAALNKPPFIGMFRPDVSLDELNDGSDPNGEWSLIICDNFPADIGSLEYVSLSFAPGASEEGVTTGSLSNKNFNSISILKQENLF